MRYNDLFAPMVKAMQELKAENDELKRKLTEYEQTQALIISEIEKLKSLKSETKEIKLGEK